jgi:transcriptional regulator with XRE-family HTH domain
VPSPSRTPHHHALGRAVRELRARHDVSQEELGFRCGLHRNYVGAIERGELNPTLGVLLRLSAGLRVALSELLTLAELRAAGDVRHAAPPPAPACRGRRRAGSARLLPLWNGRLAAERRCTCGRSEAQQRRDAAERLELVAPVQREQLCRLQQRG